MMRLPLLLLGALCLTLAACGSSPPFGPISTATGPSSNVVVLNGTSLPQPGAVDSISQLRPYQIGPLDELEIGVFGIEELQRQSYRVDAAGRISFPLIGSLDAAGLTLAQLEDEITTRLRGSFVRDPQVFANLKEATSQVVTVSGQVKQPGLYPVLGKMTLMQAIATARGVDDFAKREEVVVFRNVGDQRYAAIYDLAAIEHGNYADPEIFPRDVVIVGESAQRRALRDIIGVAPAVLAPLLVALTNGSGN